jgi:hypothetical protein
MAFASVEANAPRTASGDSSLITFAMPDALRQPAIIANANVAEKTTARTIWPLRRKNMSNQTMKRFYAQSDRCPQCESDGLTRVVPTTWEPVIAAIEKHWREI